MTDELVARIQVEYKPFELWFERWFWQVETRHKSPAPDPREFWFVVGHGLSATERLAERAARRAVRRVERQAQVHERRNRRAKEQTDE